MKVAKVRFLMYAIPLSALEGNLAGNPFRVSERDLLTSMSINEGLSEGLKYYYELVYRNDLLALGECLYRKKRLFAIRAKKRILSEGLTRRFGNILPWGNIFTTGL